jgi:hypothetical protein
MSDQIILSDIANEHLPHEIDQLRGTFRQLEEMEKAGAAEPSDVTTRILKNALIESFCVHARTLIDFFANRPTNDDVVAEHFGCFPALLKPNEKPLSCLRTTLNKQIFHLTRNRTIIDAKKFDVSTDGVEVLRMIEPEIERFNKLRPLECRVPPVEAPSLPSRTTTALAAKTIGGPP